jgi:hypothetical protein
MPGQKKKSQMQAAARSRRGLRSACGARSLAVYGGIWERFDFI